MTWHTGAFQRLPIAFGVLIFGGTILVGCSNSSPAVRPTTTALPASASAAGTAVAATAPAAAIPLIGSATGNAPPFKPLDNTWQSYQTGGTATIALRYPPAWTLTQDTVSVDMELRPPTSDPDHPLR